MIYVVGQHLLSLFLFSQLSDGGHNSDNCELEDTTVVVDTMGRRPLNL
jgi:hypothetical protein